MIELPMFRHPSQPRPESPARQLSDAPPADAGTIDAGWSQADELAALEVVWDSLCQDAASPVASLQMPKISRTTPAPVDRQSPLRQRNRFTEGPARLAS
jgi:hypothetical protein